MNYHDNQPARVGDTLIMGTFGTCRVLSITPSPSALARVRNVCTGEEWELDDLSEADLIERAAVSPKALQCAECGHRMAVQIDGCPSCGAPPSSIFRLPQ